MKSLFVILTLVISSLTWACNSNEFVRHQNPDGTIGGLKSVKASVSSQAYIGRDARICDSAWIDSGVRILDSSIVKENAWIRSNSEISGAAVVGGSSIVKGGGRVATKISRCAIVTGKQIGRAHV